MGILLKLKANGSNVLLAGDMQFAVPEVTGLDTLVPQAAQVDRPRTATGQDIVITVRADGTVLLNQEPIEMAALRARLVSLFRNHPNHVAFVRGEPDLEFRQVAEVIDIAKGAGINRIGLMTR